MWKFIKVSKIYSVTFFDSIIGSGTTVTSNAISWDQKFRFFCSKSPWIWLRKMFVLDFDSEGKELQLGFWKKRL